MRLVLFVASMSLVWSLAMAKPNSNTTNSSSSFLHTTEAMLTLGESSNDGHFIGNLTSGHIPQRTTEAMKIDGDDMDDGRIVGGKPSTKGYWPFMAAIIHDSFDNLEVGHTLEVYRCSGYVWDEQTIITAAHCL